MIGVCQPLLKQLLELLFGIPLVQQLALDVSQLVPPQRADARIGLLAVVADDRLLVRVVVVSVVLLDVLELLCFAISLMASSVVV